MPVLRKNHLLMAGAVALAVALAAPVPATASTLPTDIVAGYMLRSGRIPAGEAPGIAAAGGILETADGTVLWSRQGDIERPMASTTKLMTALVALKKGDLDKVVTVSEKASAQPTAGLRPGQRFTERQLMALMLVHSANDAAWALGEGVAGDMPKFVKMMNDQAAALGLKYTHFANPHGLDAPGHFSTPANLATLARTVMAYPEFREITSQSSVTVPGTDTFSTTDRLLGNYAGLEAGKTGYTDGAGYCFVGVAKRNGISLIAVVLNTDSTEARFSQTARLLDWGFEHVRMRKLASAGDPAGSAVVGGDSAVTVPGRLVEGTTVPVLDVQPAPVRKVDLDKDLPAPVFEGQPIGQAVWTSGNRVVARSPVVAAATVAAAHETVGAIPVTDFTDTTVDVEVGPLPAVVQFDPARKVGRRVMVDTQVSAPVAKGQRLGELTYVQGGKTVATVPIVAAESVAAPDVFQRIGIWFTRTWHGLFGGAQVAERRVDQAWAR